MHLAQELGGGILYLRGKAATTPLICCKVGVHLWHRRQAVCKQKWVRTQDLQHQHASGRPSNHLRPTPTPFSSILELIISVYSIVVHLDWRAPISLKHDTTPVEIDQFQQASAHIFLDPTGLVNFFQCISYDRLQQVRQNWYCKGLKVSLLFKCCCFTNGFFVDRYINEIQK